MTRHFNISILLGLASLCLASCEMATLTAIDHSKDGCREVVFQTDTLTFKDTLLLRAACDGSSGTVHLDHVHIDGKLIAYSIPLTLKGNGEQDTLAITHGMKGAGHYMLEFFLCEGAWSRPVEIPIHIRPDSTSVIHNRIYLNTHGTYYTSPVGGGYSQPHNILEEPNGIIPVELGQTQNLILLTGLDSRQADELGLRISDIGITVSDRSIVKMTSLELKTTYYLLGAYNGTKGKCSAVWINLYPLKKGKCSLTMEFWNDTATVELEVMDPRDIIKL